MYKENFQMPLWQLTYHSDSEEENFHFLNIHYSNANTIMVQC